MIGFNRVNMQKTRFVYFLLNDKGDSFRKVKPKDFPKQIATQNMWLQGSRLMGVYTADTGTVWIDTWQVLRELDTESPSFGSGMTAHIWYQLVQGVERYKMPYLIPHDFLREYVAKYKPIALPTLVKENMADTPDAESQ